MPNHFQPLRCIYITTLVGLLVTTAVTAQPNEHSIYLYSLSLEDFANVFFTTAGKPSELIADIPASKVPVPYTH